jgi:aromatic-amino-acid transaminase
LRPIVLGRHAGDARIVGLHTPGGCGALSLGFKLIAAARPDARVLVGTPTWPKSYSGDQGGGARSGELSLLRPRAAAIRFDEMIERFDAADRGDVVLLHGCCHNPDGGGPRRRSMGAGRAGRVAARAAAVRGYCLSGAWPRLEEDARGLHLLLDACDEVIVAHSCDKNFGLYRDRVGSLWIKTAKEESSRRGHGTCAPDFARNVVDAARSWRRRRAPGA